MSMRHRLELVIDAKTERSTRSILSKIFGKDVVSSIKSDEFLRRFDLMFVEHDFEIPNEESFYKAISGNNKVTIIYDDSFARRASEILECCLSVELRLKKLLVYVLPEIVKALDEEIQTKKAIALCRSIRKMYFGELVAALNMDLAGVYRAELMKNNGEELAKILNNAETFGDFKTAVAPYLESTTVWDVVCEVLKDNLPYDEAKEVKDEIEWLYNIRNGSAHPSCRLTDADVEKAKKYSDAVLKITARTKSNYIKAIDLKLKDITKVVSDSPTRIRNEMLQGIIDAVNASRKLPDIPAVMSSQVSLYERYLAVANEEMKEVGRTLDSLLGLVRD